MSGAPIEGLKRNPINPTYSSHCNDSPTPKSGGFLWGPVGKDVVLFNPILLGLVNYKYTGSRLFA